MSYIGTEPKDIRSFGRTKFDYTATQGQTAFTGADDDGKVLAFTVGQIEVYVNGILMDDSDFTTTGTGTVTLATAANLNDVVNVVSFETNIPDSNYVPASGGTFTGDVDFGANKITYANIYDNLSDLPSASTYHGMFAHVHATGLAYYAHAGAWIPLANLTGAGFTGNVTTTAKVGVGTSSIGGSDKVAILGGKLRATESIAQSGNSLDNGTYSGITINNSNDANGDLAGIAMYPTSQYTAAAGVFGARESQTAAGLSFWTGSNTGSERMRINADGAVTKPSQPMASAGSTMGGAGANLHPATTIYVQKGGTNLAANGRFTCPVAGVYRATLTGYTNYTNSYGYIYLKKNGSTHGYNHHFNNNGSNATFHQIVGMTQLVDCAASDYLEFWGGNGNGYVHYSIMTFELVG